MNVPISLALFSLVAGGLFAGCADDDGAAAANGVDAGDAGSQGLTQVLVGALSNSDVKVGVIATPQRARLFFCGGPESYEQMTRWVVVEVDRDAAFELEDDGWRISGQFERENLAGTLEREGEESSEFAARRVDPDTTAGLYEGMDRCGRVGLIVTQSSPTDTASAQGACVGPDHLPEQVNPILPVAQEDDGSIEVELAGDDEPRVASVTAAAAPE